MKRDEPKEEQLWQKTLKERSEAVKKQTGFRYVIEALVGGDFAREVAGPCVSSLEYSPSSQDAGMLRQELDGYEKKLKQRRPILVGHNQFTDLCFVYNAFFRPLPATLDGFKQEVNGLFPRIADTKFMATRGGNDMHPDENLQELYLSVKDEYAPPLRWASQSFGYLTMGGVRGKAHDAGYDSKSIAATVHSHLPDIFGYRLTLRP